MTTTGTVEMVREGQRLFALRGTRGDYTIGTVKGGWQPELGQQVRGDLDSCGDVALQVGAKVVEVNLLASSCTRAAAWDMLTQQRPRSAA